MAGKILRSCAWCGQEFHPTPAQLRKGYGKFCSMPCSAAAQKGSLKPNSGPHRVPPEQRFWNKVEKTEGGCWLWRAGTLDSGYGEFWLRGTNVLAHRFAYEHMVGPIPEGMEIDHVRARGCTSRACCRPDHLEAVSPRENGLRSDNPAALNSRKTSCKRGHKLEGQNLLLRPDGSRQCRTCRAAYRNRGWWTRNREKVNARNREKRRAKRAMEGCKP